MQKIRHSLKRGIALGLSAAMAISLMSGIFENTVKAEEPEGIKGTAISNGSLSIEIGDLGQISTMNIVNNRKNSFDDDVNFVLPNDTSPQNNEAHQWMGEMIFSYRTSEDGKFPEGREGFVEVDTNKTLAAGGSTTASDIKADNPYITKDKKSDKEVEVTFKGVEGDAGTERSMKGFNVTSNYNMDTEDGSLLWNITLENTGKNYIEFGDVGLPMPWNNKYTSIDSTYNERVTAHTFAGADSGYAYAIRCSGEGNYVLFTPVPESGARIEYVDNWVGQNNGVTGERAGEAFANWTSDGGGWQPGLSVYYIHSKDIQKTGRGYYTDATSLVLEPGKSKTYTFRFSAVRAGDNTPQENAESENNASDSVEERENNMRSILYKSGMIDAVAVPGFQTALNMETKLDLHYDDEKIKVDSVDIQCVHENDPFDEKHIPEQTEGLVNNSRTGECANSDSATLAETKTVNGEKHHIYNLKFGCIGNNSVRVNYKLKVGDNWVDKFTQYEFNALEKLDKIAETHADFMVNQTQDNNPDSPTYGNYQDWYLSSGVDTRAQSHWGDDWSHDNINFMTMKNYLNPVASEVKSIEKYLIDYMWNSYMKNTQDTYTVANYLGASSIYSDTSSPYTRTYSQQMEVTGFFNMYRIQKAYPDLIKYRQTAEWYLEKAYGIYINQVDDYPIGYYGEQQIPEIIEALKDEGMTEEADRLTERFAKDKGTNMATVDYPYGSEFVYDNTGEEGAYAAAKALREYYPEDGNADKALKNMNKAEWKTRAMRGIQPTWYQYADPVFLGGEHWWNFQYTASLAGSIMDDWLRYQDNGWDTDSSAWAQRVNYAAKLSNFNAVNMGQISDQSVGSVSWRYTMYKGGHGAMNVNDGGTRVMNNGWNDFSGESEEGLYGSLLRISSDVVTDPIFGLTGYGSTVSKSGTSYTVTPSDGIGKRINIIDEKIYAELEEDACTQAVIDSAGPSFNLSLNVLANAKHLSRIKLSGAGLKDGYYTVKLDGKDAGQCYVKNHEGIANVVIPKGAKTATVEILFKGEGKNTAPVISKVKTVITDKTEGAKEELQAEVPFRLESVAYDDGAPNGTLSYKWETVSAPEGGEVKLETFDRPYTAITCTRVGRYTVKLTVTDGELSTDSTLQFVVGSAPEKKAPVITKAEAEQEPVNTSVANLTAAAEADSYYDNELKYEWTVTGQPEGGNAVIANADKAEARMKASMPGEYVLCLKVTDEKASEYETTTSSKKYVTVSMTGKVDGIERLGTVVTLKGAAPKLPEKAEKVVYPDGTMKDSAIVWSEVKPESYEEIGEFGVEGTIEGTELKVLVNVQVINAVQENLAPKATPTAIFEDPADLGGAAVLNNGFEPTASGDTSHGAWHNWNGAQAEEAWVQYTWDEPVTIYQSDAYYFKDGNNNFQPKDVSYEYLAADGKTWRSLTGVEGCGAEIDRYNTTTFDTVTTTALKMTMTPKQLGCGVIEWKVMGYSVVEEDEGIVDKSELNNLISDAGDLNIKLFEDGAKDTLDAAIAEAKKVQSDEKATQAEVDIAAARLSRVIIALPVKEGNYAYNAKVSTSFVSGWESLAAVNDGVLPGNSTNPKAPRYGTWGNVSEFETVTYTWNSKIRLNAAEIYLWHDGDDENSGGIKFPKSYSYEYLDGKEWKTVENPSAYGLELHKYNKTTFTPIETTAIRVKLNKQEADGNGVGILEWKVYGENFSGDKTELNKLIGEKEAFVAEGSKDYSGASWNILLNALEVAKKVAAEEKAGQEEVQAAVDSLNNAARDLVPGKGLRNLAWQATPEGTCNYDGQEGRPDDQGGLPTMKDGKEPTGSDDLSNGSWFNWNDRYESGTVNAKEAWVSYSWTEPVILESTDAYYFSEGEGAGHEMPKSVRFEYKNESGDWTEVPNAQGLGCERNQYNTTSLGYIETTALRMVLEPKRKDSADDPLHGVGVIEWKVNGILASEVNKTKLNTAIAEAEKLKAEDYTSSSWKKLKKALKDAKASVSSALSQDVLDEQTASLKAAMNALIPETGIQKGTLTALISTAEDYVKSADYTAESRDALAAVLETAKTVANNENATQKEINKQVKALTEALDSMKDVAVVSVKKTELEAAVREAEARTKDEGTDETAWAEFEQILKEAKEIAGSDAATQEQVNQQVVRLNRALDRLDGVLSIDTEALSKLYSEAAAIQKDWYTEASYQNLQDAVKAAEATLRTYETQEEIDSEVSALQKAINGLEKVYREKTELASKITEATRYTGENYTKTSYEALQEALKAAREIFNNASAGREDVTAATIALMNAVNGLEEKQVVSIRFKEEPDQTVYLAGEPIHSSDLQLEAVYNDGFAETITDGFEISGYDPEKTGDQTVTVTYEGQSVRFRVTVEEAQVLEHKETGVSVIADAYQDQDLTGVTLSVKKETSSSNEQIANMLSDIGETIKKAYETVKDFAVSDENAHILDIKLVKDGTGEEVQPEESILIVIKKPEGYSKNLKLFHNHKDGLKEISYSWRGEDEIAFRTDSLSLFTMVDLGEAPAKADKSELEALINSVQQIEAKDYTEETWNVLQNALWNAIEVFKNAETDQASVDAQVTALNAAVSGLKKPEKPTEPEKPVQPQKPATVRVSKIKITGLSKKIAAGKKVKLTAKVSPSNATNKGVTWKSSNKKVATVNSKGVVTMKKKSGGKSVIITATAKDGSKVKATYKIKSMKGRVTKVAISGKKSVKAGRTLKLKAKVTATKSANKKVKWTSSNKKYATVTSSGKVKTYKAGKGKSVKITAMATDGSGKKKTVKIRITK